ncbi:MAG: hypothetical protein WD354_10575 [Acidimicrobiia bacterium]
MTSATEHSPVWRPLIGSGVFALIWVVVALARPTTTFHLAPAIVAIWPAVTGGGRRSVFYSASGLLVATATTLALSASGMLQGATLLPWGGPAVESVFAAGVGSLLGLLIGSRRSRAGEWLLNGHDGDCRCCDTRRNTTVSDPLNWP